MLIDFRQFLYDSVETVLFKADFVLHDRNAKVNTSTQSEYTVYIIFCLLVLGFYGPVNNDVMSSRSVNKGTVPGQA